MKNIYNLLRSAAIICLFLMCGVSNIHAQNKVATASAQALVQKHSAAIGLSSTDLLNTRITDAHYDQISGATLIYLQQTFRGIDIHNKIQALAFKNEKPVSVLGSYIHQAKKNANVSGLIPGFSSTDAVAAAAVYLGLQAPASFSFISSKPGPGLETDFGTLGIAANNIKAKLIWIPAGDKQLKLSWEVQIQPIGKSDYWMVKVDATNGQVLGKYNLTNYDKRGTPVPDKKPSPPQKPEETFSKAASKKSKVPKDIISATYRVIPFPAESPIHPGGEPALQTDPWTFAPAGSNATTLQWNYDGVTYFDSTRGNNVLAQEDGNANNGPGRGAHSSSATPSLTFDYAPDFTKEPPDSLNQGFAITNLFYWTNILHDISYLYGFDEASGNFQANNLGRGGLDNDYLLADAQDGSGLNNANFTTPADGSSPRMQIFLYAGTPQVDGDLDNGLICHEYAHGISSRLTGGPANPGCLSNKEEMGEGWSDYFALMITTNWATAQTGDGNKKRPWATYALNEPVTGNGFRKYPYSTDMTIDPETYADLAATGGEAHNIGEIWTAVLWDMTWFIIQMDGINPNLYNVNDNGGNSVAMKLVMQGLKLQPCSPGFLDGRDAILKADTLLYNGRYSCAIWRAFARRGMGVKASQGDPDSYTDQVADFSIYSNPYIVTHVDKPFAAPGETINYSVRVVAPLCESISNYTVVDTLPPNITFVSGEGIYSTTDKTVKINGINVNQGESKSFAIKAKIKEDSYSLPVQYISDSVISSAISPAWQTTSTTGTTWVNSSVRSHSAPNSYFARDSSGDTNEALETSISYTLTGKSVLSFWHYYNVEAGYDGGVVDISVDDGATWQDLGPYITENGYSGLLIPHTPLIGGRQSFTGSSNDQFILTKIDLSAFIGKTVRIRFLFVSDESGGADGWYVDDIHLKSESVVFNRAQLFDNDNRLITVGDTITIITNITLPVTLLNFSGTAHDKQNLLLWTTSTELNNSGFEVQRGTDGINFVRIDFINSKSINGNSMVKLDYKFTDMDFIAATNYYRLKQVDKDGNFVYSNTVVLKNNNAPFTSTLVVYPSPARDILNIKISSQASGRATLFITDLLGKSLLNKETDLINGVNTIPIDISRLSKGSYFLKLLCNNGCESAVKKFARQ